MIDDVIIKTGHFIKITPAMGAQGCKNITIGNGAVSASIFFSNLTTTVKNALKVKKFDILNSDLEVDATVRSYNGKPLLVGPRGGCYYINSNGNKTYVDRSFCGTD